MMIRRRKMTRKRKEMTKRKAKRKTIRIRRKERRVTHRRHLPAVAVVAVKILIKTRSLRKWS